MVKSFFFLKKYFLAFLSCTYLFAVGFLLRKNRLLITQICEHFGFRLYEIDPIIPTIKLSEIVDSTNPIEIHDPMPVDGNISLLEIIVINNLIKNYLPKHIFEIGTFNGRTTLNIAANSDDNTMVYTLDLPKNQINHTFFTIENSDKAYIDKNVPGLLFLGTEMERKIVQLYGDSAQFDFSPFYNSVDFIFIDGSHSYDYVLNDSRIAFKMLISGSGIIIWHDYGIWPGVTKALNELYANQPEFRNIKHIEGTSLAIAIY